MTPPGLDQATFDGGHVVSSNSTKHGRNKLTVKQINAATLQPDQKIRKLADGAGLTLTLRHGADGIKRYWHLRYTDPITKKEQTASLGTYPNTGLAQAREKTKAIKKDLEAGITPRDRERIQKQKLRAARQSEKQTFMVVANSWYQECIDDGIWSSKKHQNVIKESLENHVYPSIGEKPVKEVTASDVRAIVRKIARAGTWETAQRVLQRIHTVFVWAEDEEKVNTVPTGTAQKWIKNNRPENSKGKSYASLSPAELPELVHALETEKRNMDSQTYLGVQLQALTFVRPGELRHAEWTEIDWEAKLWTIPASKMKMKREHLVPLSTPALAVLRELEEINGNRRWVLPGRISPRKPMSEATVNMALKRLKPGSDGKGAFDGRHTAHSFRHTASTYLNAYRKGDALPYMGDPVELQLAHLDKSKTRRRYNKSTLLDVRTEMMEVWGQYWLQCRDTEDKVTNLHAEATHV
jgi:integrase